MGRTRSSIPEYNTRTATSDDWFSFEMPFKGSSFICRRCAWWPSHRTGPTQYITFLAPIAQSSKDLCAHYGPRDSGVSVQRPTIGHDYYCLFVRLVILSLWSRLTVPSLTGKVFEPDLTADLPDALVPVFTHLSIFPQAFLMLPILTAAVLSFGSFILTDRRERHNSYEYGRVYSRRGADDCLHT